MRNIRQEFKKGKEGAFFCSKTTVFGLFSFFPLIEVAFHAWMLLYIYIYISENNRRC